MSFNLRPGTSLFGNITFTPGTNENYVAPPIHGGSTTTTTDQYYIVGAYSDDDADTDSGSVFVYDATDLSAAPTQLLHPNPAYRDFFGSTSASNSDKFVIVAYGDNDFAGSIFVYDKTDLSAAPVELTTPDAADWDLLGTYAIAMSDTHILAGSYGDDDGATSAGSAYLWDLSDLSASPTKLQPSNLVEYSNFGFNVALGDNHAIVSAKQTADTPSGYTDPGVIYIYDLSDLSATPTELMSPEQGDSIGASFGVGSGGSIDVLGNTLVVGAHTLTVDGNGNAGKIYLYDLSNLSAAPTELTPSISGSRFGYSVDITDTHIAVGAPTSKEGSSNGAREIGAAYVYDRSDLSAEPSVLYGADQTSKPYFGHTVRLSDTTIVVGARAETFVNADNTVESAAGAIYIWSLSDLTGAGTKLTSPNPAANDRYGNAVEILTTETTTSSESEPAPEPIDVESYLGAPDFSLEDTAPDTFLSTPWENTSNGYTGSGAFIAIDTTIDVNNSGVLFEIGGSQSGIGFAQVGNEFSYGVCKGNSTLHNMTTDVSSYDGQTGTFYLTGIRESNGGTYPEIALYWQEGGSGSTNAPILLDNQSFPDAGHDFYWGSSGGGYGQVHEYSKALPTLQNYSGTLTGLRIWKDYTTIELPSTSSSPAPAPSIVTEGLVFHVDASNTSSYSGSGTTWTDLSGNGIDGTLVNGPTYSSDDGGKIVFDNSDDYINFASPSLAFGTGPFAMEIWVKVTSAPDQFDQIMQGRNPDGTSVFWGYRNGALDFVNNNDTYPLLSKSWPTQGEWTHLVVTRDASNIVSLYRNGVLDEGTVSNELSFDQTEMTIGSSFGYNVGREVGLARLYVNKGLSAEEVTQNYDDAKSRFGH